MYMQLLIYSQIYKYNLFSMCAPWTRVFVADHLVPDNQLVCSSPGKIIPTLGTPWLLQIFGSS